jgi:hypothetical protein
MPVEKLARRVPAVRRSSSAGMVSSADIVTVLQHTKTRCMTSVDTCSTADDALAGVRMTSADRPRDKKAHGRSTVHCTLCHKQSVRITYARSRQHNTVHRSHGCCPSSSIHVRDCDDLPYPSSELGTAPRLGGGMTSGSKAPVLTSYLPR